MLNWSKMVPVLSPELKNFVNGNLSAENLYKKAVVKGVGPELRPLVRKGASRGRRVAREALRRRNLLG